MLSVPFLGWWSCRWPWGLSASVTVWALCFETETTPPCFSSKSFNKRARHYKPNHYTERPTFFLGRLQWDNTDFLVFVSSKLCYLISFQQNSSVATLTVLPLSGWELVISFHQSLKQPGCSGTYQESTFLRCYVSKQTPSHEAQNTFKDKMAGFNCKTKFPAWAHRLVEQQQCEVAMNLKEELNFQKNWSNLRSQFPNS